MDPNWAEEVTAVGTAVGALGLLGAIGAAIFAGQQVREARRARQAEIAAEFVRRWNEDALVETRRLVNTFNDGEELSSAFQRYVAENSVEASILYRELDYFEQLGALEHEQALDFGLIRLLLGRSLIDRWNMWQPALDEIHGPGTYPMFRYLVSKMTQSLKTESAAAVSTTPSSGKGDGAHGSD
jgi:hypothetical protein